jgi:hypothetical protein
MWFKIEIVWLFFIKLSHVEFQSVSHGLGLDVKAQAVWQARPLYSAFIFNLQRMPEINNITCSLENGVCCTQELSEQTNYENQEGSHSIWRRTNESNGTEEDRRWRKLQFSSTYRTKELHPTEFHDISI